MSWYSSSGTMNKPTIKVIRWEATSTQLPELLMLIEARWSIDHWTSQKSKNLYSANNFKLLPHLTHYQRHWQIGQMDDIEFHFPKEYGYEVFLIDEFRTRSAMFQRLNYRDFPNNPTRKDNIPEGGLQGSRLWHRTAFSHETELFLVSAAQGRPQSNRGH